MAQLEAPPAPIEREDPVPAPHPPRFAGDDAVPRGLAVTSAVTLRVIVVLGGIVVLGLFAKLMMVVVVPVIIALLLATLLQPMAQWLRAHRVPAAPAAILPVLLAFLVFLGLWGLVIPPFISQVPEVVDGVQRGAGQVADAVKPLGISDDDVQGAIQRAREELKGGKAAGTVLNGAMLLVQWAAAVVLIVALTIFFLKDG